MSKPKNILVYYGYLNSFNSAQNGWSNEKVAQDFAKYGILVFGDGIQNPQHADYANTQVIIPRIKALNPDCLVFGYVTVNQSYANFTDKVDQWDDLGVHGIFMDEAGYDYGSVETNGRSAFNSKVDYVHSLDMVCMANAWKSRYVLGTDDDVNYPNSTWNSSEVESNLDTDDWCFIESMCIKTDLSWESAADWTSHKADWLAARSATPVKLAALSIIQDSDQNGQDKFNFLYHCALALGLDAVGSSDQYYGASSATSKLWDRPEIGDVFNFTGEYSNNVQTDGSDADVRLKYFKHCLVKLDFSSGAQASSVVRY